MIIPRDFLVLDVPQPPSEVRVDEVRAKSCVINWQKPKEDGGCAITRYIIERHDISKKG